MGIRPAPWILAACLWAAAGIASAQQTSSSPLDRQEQLRQAEQISERQQQDRQAPFAGTPTAPAEGGGAWALPEETPCFPITRVRLFGGGADWDRFGWLLKSLRRYEGQCVGRAGIALIRRRALDQLFARGLVTTRIGVPEQDLSGGELRLELMPGRLRAVRVVSERPGGSWRSALPIRPGDLLDLRAIEQAVEQFKRLASQDAKIDIAPGEEPGESDLIVTLQHARRWRGVLNADDAGVQATGRVQSGLDLSVDNPLGLNDLFGIGYSHDLADQDQARGTRGNSLSYSLPWGWWTFSLSTSSYRYHQQVQGFQQRFRSSGQSSSTQLDLQRVVARGGKHKTALGMTLARRRARSYLDGVEIAIQRRDTTSAEFYLTHRHYLGAMQVDARLAHRRGTPWFDGQWTGYDPQVGFPSFRYGVTSLDLGMALPLRLGPAALSWESNLRAQTAGELLLGSEFITIGGRYSVRGFDGEAALGAEKGAYWRNTLSLTLLGGRLSPYLGLDAGRVDGRSAEGLPGRSLVGGAVGVRGGWHGASVDAFAGWPIHRPDGFGSAQPTYGARVIYQF
ncbi:ShlB/FhaC/HecB family hemolysin secretion/activation protein [Pseudoxanthomonas composti]|uniref:ShlB/FhaC/HecB family hemolysin secretion/activation protein n=1 Tax=Pseudoxanthomonas composti TaxID=2137479 RepID=A0A4Q1K0F0_9GAMM|nr:ShlB/FhaC/HecB family hemolysin secretion/activation protein [Pseudoxanthomonas composti]RXR08662.1 ShlB/FhaC/HecB family hemolysin secretion/activation protein [Pseudoxanthomonas composti]